MTRQLIVCSNKKCKAEIVTSKFKGKVQCAKCGKRSEL